MLLPSLFLPIAAAATLAAGAIVLAVRAWRQRRAEDALIDAFGRRARNEISLGARAGQDIDGAAIDAVWTALPEALGARAWTSLTSAISEAIHAQPFDASATDDRLNVLTHFLQRYKMNEDPLRIVGVPERMLALYVYVDLASGRFEFPAMNGRACAVALKPGEAAVFQWESAGLVKDVAHREYVGGSSGVSVRVAKGLTVHSSQSHGHSVTVTEREIVDHGPVTLTSEALVFIGKHDSHRLPLAKIYSYEDWGHGIRVAIEGRQHPLTLQLRLSDFACAALPLLIARAQAAVKPRKAIAHG